MDSRPVRATRLRSPRFVAFLAAQFLGAANDNAFKMALTLFVLANVAGERAQVGANSLATALFPLPFLLFSPLAGWLGDRFRKDRMVALTKAPEILAMTLAVGAFAAQSLSMLMAVLFLMATQSAFFSPPKYGLLPESIAREDLSMANGVLQMTTNLAILAGAVAGALLFDAFRERPARIGQTLLAVAVAGTLAACFVPRTPKGRREARFAWNPIAASRADWRLIRGETQLVQTLAGIAYFGFLGSVFLTVIPVFGKSVIGLSESGAGMMLMALSVGIALGSVLAGKLSRGRIEVGLVPLGSIGLALFSLALALSKGGGPRLPLGLPLGTATILLLLGLSAGLYVVPLNALLQERSPEGMKGRLIGFANVLTFGAVLLAAAVPPVLGLFEVDVAGIVLACSLVTLGATAYIMILLPTFLVRLVLYLVTTTLYRLEAHGTDNIPHDGALLVANHVSWIDAFLVGAASERMVRFLMYRPYYEAKALSWFFRRMKVIPIAGSDTPEQRDESLLRARAEIEAGHVVCIFAEGAITRSGNLLKFRRGFERIAEGSSAPIVPVCIDGVWGSIFSWQGGRLLWKWPRRVRDPVRVLFGPPLPSSSTAHEVRRAVQELSVEASRLRQRARRGLEAEMLRVARRGLELPLLADASGRRLTRGETFLRALGLRAALEAEGVAPDERIGILAPPGIDGALANLAVLMAGATVVNLDDEGAERLRAETREAGLRLVLTTRRRAEGLAPDIAETGARVVAIEELAGRARVGLGDRLALRLLPLAAARRRFFHGRDADLDRVAAIVFSAAPHLEGRVRGAELTHRNILANLDSLRQVFRLTREDRLLGTIPFANSFGLVGSLLLPAVGGVQVLYAPDEPAALPEGERITVLPLPPARLAAWLDAAPPAALRELRHAVVAGGELASGLRARYLDRVGVEPLEGFGCAECAPLVSLNLPEIVREKAGQSAARPGTQGHPLPGIAVRIVDPETRRELGPDQEGLLWVKGPNVMRGYLNDGALTDRVLRDGWYSTGFRASQDTDGFLTVFEPGRPQRTA